MSIRPIRPGARPVIVPDYVRELLIGAGLVLAVALTITVLVL